MSVIVSTTRLHMTFRLARAAGACKNGFHDVFDAFGGEAYGWDTPVPLAKVLEISGLNAAIWALRCVPPEQEAERDRIARLFACDCAEAVLPIFERHRPGDTRPREAIAVARRFAIGAATREELAAASANDGAAGDAARARAWDAAWNTPLTAARTLAWTAARATGGGAAAWDAARTAARIRFANLFLVRLEQQDVRA